MANWSDVELAAFVAASKVASERCLELRKTAFDGPDLLALARLCSLGQEWPSTYSAAVRYVRDPKATERLEGYSLLLQADLNMQGWADSVEQMIALHKSMPTGNAVAALVDQTVRSLEVPQTSYALQIALIFQNDFLKCITACGTDLKPARAEGMAWKTMTLLREMQSTSLAGALRELKEALAAAAPVASKDTGTVATPSRSEAAPAQKRFESIGAALPAGLRPSKASGTRARTAAAARPDSTVYVLWSDPRLTVDEHFRKELELARARLAARAQIIAVQFGCTSAVKPIQCAPQDLATALGADTAVTILGVDPEGRIAWNVPGSAGSLRAGAAVDAVASKLP